MQWVAGIDADLAFNELTSQTLAVPFRDVQIRVCGVEHLRAMKRAASRPQDLKDLDNSMVPEPGALGYGQPCHWL